MVLHLVDAEVIAPPDEPDAPAPHLDSGAAPVPTGAVSGATPPSVIDPALILDRMAAAVADDPFIETLTGMGLLNKQVVRLHAQAMKFLLRSCPGRAAAYRSIFEGAYADTVFARSGVAAAEFDAATPADVSYVAFFACVPALDKARAMELYAAIGKCTTLLGHAMLDAYPLLAPGGLMEPTFALACAIVRSDLVSVGGKLEYSEMDENATIDGREVEDNDISAIQERVDLLYAPVIGATKAALIRNMIDKAVSKVAMERPFHDVRSYLLSLPPWDRKRRLKYVVRDLLRAEPRGDDLRSILRMPRTKRAEIVKRIGLYRKMLRKLFIAGVARTLRPGCKHDSVLILKGKQGRMKSTFFRTITPCGRFSDNDMELKEKDSKLELRKAFIFEWSELSTLRSARDWETVKGFLARQEDMVRPPYAKRAMVRQRHCLIVGTTNEAEFLSDSTGSRRFWVIETGDSQADLKKTAEQRDQLWAEALHLYRQGFNWWFEGSEDALRERVNGQHSVEDPWTFSVEEFMDRRTEDGGRPPSSNEVLALALHMDPAKTTKADVRRVGQVLRTLKYESRDSWDPGLKKSYKGWVPTPPGEA